MIGLVRAAALCATLALGLNSAFAADKTFKRDDLADSAIKLEAEIKKEAGPVAKSTATLKTDADAAYIYLGRARHACRTTRAATPEGIDAFITLDWDNEHLVGIEILDASARLPREVLEQADQPN